MHNKDACVLLVFHEQQVGGKQGKKNDQEVFQKDKDPSFPT